MKNSGQALIDAAGFIHTPVCPETSKPRIVSPVPSLTELLCALGLARWLVGRTGFCIHPADIVASIPKIGGTKTVNIKKIRSLAPTHLIVNIDENEKLTIAALAQFIPHIVVTHPLTPVDNLALYQLLGAIFQALPQADFLCAEFNKTYQTLKNQPARPVKKVLYCI